LKEKKEEITGLNENIENLNSENQAKEEEKENILKEVEELK